MLRPYNRRKTCRTQHHDRIRIRYDRTYRRQRRDRAVVQRGRASHHARLRGPALRHVAHEAPQLDFAFVCHGAGIDDGEISVRRIVDDGGAAIAEGLANQIGVVLVRLASERVEVDVHGRTVSPSRSVHTRSVSPAPLRCSRSMPRSSRPRPPENWRPSPPENPTSVGVCPTEQGDYTPRNPNRAGAERTVLASTAHFWWVCVM